MPQKRKYTIIIFLCLFCIPILSLAQNNDLNLADEYFAKEEYDKAEVLYEKLAKSNRNLPFLYKNYLQTLYLSKNFKEAEKLIKRQIKLEPDNPVYQIDYGFFWDIQGKNTKAEAQYEDVIDKFRKQDHRILLATEHFLKIDKNEYAEKMLLAARKAKKDKTSYAVELAEVYQIQNKKNKMIQEYLTHAIKEPGNIEFVKNALQDRISKQTDFDQLENILLGQVQKSPNEVTYNELLLWLYLQQKRFYRAFIQAKALDKRYHLEGSELLNIGLISLRNKDFKSAQKIFKYIIETYPKGTNYPTARNYYIKSKEEIIKNTFPIQQEAIYSLIADYDKLVKEVGKNYKTFDAIRSKALLYAFYLNEKDKAVDILTEAIAISRGKTDFIARCKTDLGDIYLLKNEPWEATLLYSQVEKLKKEHPLGHEAKLRNAKLSYFKGNFDLAQEHLDILKEATSREIANDAMDLSLLIQDNIAFDTTRAALKDFANTELMVFQHQDEKALKNLDEMLTKYQKHSLFDEILWEKSNLLLKLGRPQEAVNELQKIVDNYPEDILGDDAYFLMAKTYEEVLKEKEKAKQLYKNYLTKYPGSIYTSEARKRFRILRGDFIN